MIAGRRMVCLIASDLGDAGDAWVAGVLAAFLDDLENYLRLHAEFEKLYPESER